MHRLSSYGPRVAGRKRHRWMPPHVSVFGGYTRDTRFARRPSTVGARQGLQRADSSLRVCNGRRPGTVNPLGVPRRRLDECDPDQHGSSARLRFKLQITITNATWPWFEQRNFPDYPLASYARCAGCRGKSTFISTRATLQDLCSPAEEVKTAFDQ